MKNADMPAMPVNNGELASALELGADGSKGLTKREICAIKIMASLSSTNLDDATRLLKATGCDDLGEMYAGMAVEYADALIKELEK